MKAHGKTQRLRSNAQARMPFRQNASLSEDQLWTDESFRLTVLSQVAVIGGTAGYTVGVGVIDVMCLCPVMRLGKLSFAR